MSTLKKGIMDHNWATQTNIAVTSGDYQLHGTLHRPHGTGPFALVIGSHGLLASGESPKQIALAQQLTRRGLAYFRFDHRGCGQSEGDLHAATTFAGRCEDLLNAAKMLLERPDLRRPLGLFGSSFGGAVSLACARALDAAAVVTLAAPAASSGIAPDAIADFLATEPYPGAVNREALTFDLADPVSAVSNLLVIHGSADDVVPLDNARRLHAMAQAPKKLLELPEGDHRLSNPEHQEVFLSAAVDWFETKIR